MGRMLAWQLSQHGHKVSVFDRDTANAGAAAGYTAAGMLTPYTEAESAEEIIFKLGKRSLTLWPKLISELHKPVRYNKKGSLVVAHPNDTQDLLHFKSQVTHKLQPNKQAFVDLDKKGIAELEPELSQTFSTAYYLPDEAWVSSNDFMRASLTTALALGAQWHEQAEVLAVENGCIKTKEKTHQFDLAIDTRGLGAKPQWGELRGVRGELIWLQAPEVNITRLVRLMHPRYRLYLAPTQKDDMYILGATQIESDDTSAMSVLSLIHI